MSSPIDKSAARYEGERNRDDALSTLAACRAAFVLRGRRSLLWHLLIGGAATVDDVRDMIGNPVNINPKVIGAIPGALVRAGIIRAAGFSKSSRPEAHARPMTDWQLFDRGKAEAWLAAHPEPPPPIDERSQSTLWPIDRRPAPNEKSDAAATASLSNLSPATNGETTNES